MCNCNRNKNTTKPTDMKCHICNGVYHTTAIDNVYMCQTCRHRYCKVAADVPTPPSSSAADRFAYLSRFISIKPDANVLLVDEGKSLWQELQGKVRSTLLVDLNAFYQLNNNVQYDMVIAWHVLEHATDPKAFVHKCQTISKDWVVIEVSTDRIEEGIDKRTHHFWEGSLSRLLKPQGFGFVHFGNGFDMPSALAVMKINKQLL